MHKRSITFNDLQGRSVSETFWFNLTKAELIKLNFSEKGGLEAHFKRIIADDDRARIIETFEMIIFKAYGEPHEDGRQFVKSDALSNAFMQTEAYSELLIDLMSNEYKAAQFVREVVPKDLADQVPDLDDNKKVLEGVVTETVELPQPPNPTTPTPDISPLGVKKDVDAPSLEQIMAAVTAGKISLSDISTLGREELIKKIV